MLLFPDYARMWTCWKCGKPVYFAERRQSMGKDWHPVCLKCEECGKVLNPGTHAEVSCFVLWRNSHHQSYHFSAQGAPLLPCSLLCSSLWS